MEVAFPKDFAVGVATAAYQIEGAANEDGKGQSIWDVFSHTQGKTFNGDTGDVACDHYHLYKKDAALIKKLGVKYYRFSISWPRIFPEGYGKVNEKGLLFYIKLVDGLKANGIEPVVTLFHWDLPQKLQEIGGFTNRKVTDYFEDYARLIFKEFGGKVKYFITINEPATVAFAGYWHGTDAPGEKNLPAALNVIHNLLLAHGKAVKLFREMKIDGKIGISLNMGYKYSLTSSDEDRMAAERAYQYQNSWFADPIFKGAYPKEMASWYKKYVGMPEILSGDMELISSKIDFLGINNYSASMVNYDINEKPFNLHESQFGEKRTQMGWGINPKGLYDLLIRLKRDYKNPEIVITENGAAFDDVIDKDGNINDDYRIDYFKSYLKEVSLAVKDGVNIKGYFAWSLLDNFEWSFGMSKRFGLVYVDYKSQQRTVKKSGFWFGRFAKKLSFEM